MVRLLACCEKCVMKCFHLYVEWWKSDNNPKGERASERADLVLQFNVQEKKDFSQDFYL